jgi:hypothetical protein
METPDNVAPESKIPVVYTKEHLEREAAKKQRAAGKKQAEEAAEAARKPTDYPIDALGPILGPPLMRSRAKCNALLRSPGLTSSRPWLWQRNAWPTFECLGAPRYR